MDLVLIAQGLLNGLLFGGVYSLMAVGLTLLFGVMRVVNFAHGDMMVWGMYLAYLLATKAGVDPYIGFVFCAAALFVLGVVVQRGLVDRIIDSPHEMQILLMLGVALVLENAALVAFGPEPARVRSPLTQSTLWLGAVFVDVGRLVTFAIAIVLTGLLYLFLFRTGVGRTIRAAADNTYGPRVIGVDVRRVRAVAFGGALAAALGAVIGYLGFRFGLRGFYFVLLTVAFAEVCRIVASNTDAVGGALGLYVTFTGNPRQFQFQDPRAHYYIALALLLLATAVVAVMERRRFGIYLGAIREDEIASEALGVNAF